MLNIAAVLKSEISRIARKEVRAETGATKKASRSHRTEIATLKKRVQALEQHLRRVGKTGTKPVPAVETEPASGRRRFSAKGLKSMRRRLGLSAEDLGLLIGASSQSVYNWEDGKTRPQPKSLEVIDFVKTRGKREVAARLESLQT